MQIQIKIILNKKCKKKEKNRKKKRKRKNKDKKSSPRQVTFITLLLNNNVFCLLNIYPPQPLTPSLANQLMYNMI